MKAKLTKFYITLNKNICMAVNIIQRKVHLKNNLPIFLLFIFIILFSNSSTWLAIGNIFFGRITQLHNVHLAQFFYTNSAYPPFGKPSVYAHYQLGRTYFIQGRLNPALDEFNQELSLYPENKRSYYMIGLTYGYLNQEEQAIDAFQKFIDWKPETWAGRNDKAWLEFRIGKIDDALTTMKPVINQTDNPWVQNTYGVLLMNKKRYPEAKQAFQYALDAANKLTPIEWGNTYPGNDPRVYAIGLEAMKKSIKENIILVEKLASEITS